MLNSWFTAIYLAVGIVAQDRSGRDPKWPYPIPDADLARSTTKILHHSSYLQGLHDQQWYLDNIPFVDFPDKVVQDVYYYRQSIVKRHAKFTGQGHGWTFTEFIQPVDHAMKFQTIADSAPYHIAEARWLRDIRYAKDVIQAYSRGGTEGVAGFQLTHHIQRAIYEHAQVTGDVDFLTSQLDGMIYMFNLWNSTFDADQGLYFRAPVRDAQEYSLAGYIVGGPNKTAVKQFDAFDNDYTMLNKGPDSFRPSFNAYMVANSRAIADVAKLKGRADLARTWYDLSRELERNMESLLWDDSVGFWIDVIRDGDIRVYGRQLVGYFPYRFGIGLERKFIRGLEFGLNEDHFLAEFGPTTLEKTDPYYTEFKNSTTNTVWNGQSWPFSTCIYLTTLAMLARDKKSEIVTPDFFYEQLVTYAKTNMLNDVPYTAESHYPTVDAWSALQTNHSEHYFHSTYTDNIFTNLLGIVPTLDSRLELKPLIPRSWDRFAVENIPYHGALVSILWDRDGSSYPGWRHQAGFSIYINGRVAHHQRNIGPVKVNMPSQKAAIAKLASSRRYGNIMVNVNSPHGLPRTTGSTYYTPSASHDSTHAPWKLNDGNLWYDRIPDNFWSNNGIGHYWVTLGVTLPRERTFNSVSFAILGDGDDAIPVGTLPLYDCPRGISIINNRTNEVIASRNPWTDCVPNALNTVLLAAPITVEETRDVPTTPATGTDVTTDQLRIVVLSKNQKTVAFSEVQIWTPTPQGPRYEVEDGLPGTFLGGYFTRPHGMTNERKLSEDAGGESLGGGVVLHQGSWVEIADVRSKKSGRGVLTIVGAGSGSVDVRLNYLANVTATFDGSSSVESGERQSVKLNVDFLPGGNVVTLFQKEGDPFVDAIIVG